MADQIMWIGSTGPFAYDDAVEVAGDPNLGYDTANPPDQSALVTTGQIDIQSAPTLDPHVLRLVDVGVIVGNVISDANITDHAIVRGDGGAVKIQESNVLINDAGDITVVNNAWIGIGAAAERLIFATAGYVSFMGCSVGVGTSTFNVDQRLKVVYSDNTTIYVEATGVNKWAQIEIIPTGTESAYISTRNFPMVFWVNGVDRIHIATDGKVGINDVTPGESLDVDGNINTTGVYKVDDVQVVSNQGAVVANATDAASVILRLNELLARLRTHGLIDT